MRKHFLSKPTPLSGVEEMALEVCYICPCPVGILKGPERALGISPHTDVHIRLALLFTFGGQV